MRTGSLNSEENQELKMFFYKTLVLMGIVLVLYFTYALSSILTILFAAFFLSILCAPVLNWFNKKWIPDLPGIFIVYSLILFFLLILFFTILPIFVKQINLFVDYIQNIVTQGESLLFLGNTQHTYAQEFFTQNPYWVQIITIIKENIASLGKTLTTSIGVIANSGAQTLAGIAGFLLNIFSVLILTLFIVIDRKQLRAYFYLILPKKISCIISSKEEKIQETLQEWLKSQFILSITVFIFTYIGLWVLEIFGISIEEKFALALVAGGTELIPYIGPFLGFLPALVIGSSLSLKATGALIILYLIIQQVENNILVPYLMSKNLNISPLVIFLGAVVFGSLFGILGIIIAIPIIAVGKIFIEDWIDSRRKPD